MRRVMSTVVLVGALATVAVLVPRATPAQTPSDTILLSLPPASGVTCEEDRGPFPAAVPPGARAFSFAVGTPAVQLRDATGRLLAEGPPPRELGAVFDSIGRPIFLADQVALGNWRQGTAIVMFAGQEASGFRMTMVTDSAAGMVLVFREGPGAASEAARQATRVESREPLDSLGVRRARALAQHLWERRCP